jgi:hypothetical protein
MNQLNDWTFPVERIIVPKDMLIEYMMRVCDIYISFSPACR